MANMENLQTVEGGALLSALSKILFGGLDSIFNKAAEYQKEMGVLKQINNITVEDGSGNEYTVVVKLSPVKDKKDTFYAEISSPDYTKFKPGKFHQNAIKLTNSNKKDFIKLIDDICRLNGLRRVEDEDDAAKSDDSKEQESTSKANKFSESASFDFFNYYNEDEQYTVTVDIEKSQDGSEMQIVADSDPKFIKPFKFVLRKTDTKSDVGQLLADHIETDSGLVPVDENADKWDDFIDYLDTLNKSAAEEPAEGDSDTSQKEDTVASVQITLEKIVANGHEDISLVNIFCASAQESKVMQAVEDIVASDEFVDAMPEGESTYILTEDDDYYDIEPC